jgi:protocatechuate 3,4-dioxygenase beta subunit
MRRAMAAALILVAMGTAACHTRTSAAPFVGGVTLGGRVVDYRGRAVNGAQVELYTADGGSRQRPVMSAATNASGYFSLRSIDPGVYLLRVAKVGYPEWNQQVTVGNNPEQTVTVQL